MTIDDFNRVIKHTRFKPNMASAIQMVMVDKLTQAAAAQKLGVTRQAVSAAVISFKRACLEHAAIV